MSGLGFESRSFQIFPLQLYYAILPFHAFLPCGVQEQSFIVSDKLHDWLVDIILLWQQMHEGEYLVEGHQAKPKLILKSSEIHLMKPLKCALSSPFCLCDLSDFLYMKSREYFTKEVGS